MIIFLYLLGVLSDRRSLYRNDSVGRCGIPGEDQDQADIGSWGHRRKDGGHKASDVRFEDSLVCKIWKLDQS